jgi:DNA repair protein SbcC/Rad50
LIPNRLVLQAFGPFSKREEIDFRCLAGRGMLLITGTTGAGKTSILDGVMFALFDDSTGGKRKPHQMRSQHADPGLPTEVLLDFALGAETYRITRRPQQDRPAKRGTGMVTEKPTAALWKRTGFTDDAVEGVVLAEGSQDVTLKVKELVGFSGEQFRQIVVLPQGDFRRFLEASSREREDILEVLFRTESFRRVEEALVARAKQLEDSLRSLNVEETTLYAGAPAKTIEELEAKRMLAGKRVGAEGEKLGMLRDRCRILENDWNVARAIEKAFLERDIARVDRQKAEGGRATQDSRQIELRRARKALPLVPLQKQAAGRMREAEVAAKGARAASVAYEASRVALEKARGVLALEEARTPLREAAQARINELEMLRASAQDLARIRGEVARLSVAERIAAGRLRSADAALAFVREEVARKEVEVSRLATQVAPRVAWAILLTQVAAKLTSGVRLRQIEAGLPGLHSSVQSAEAGCARSKAAQSEVEAAWAGSQAALLATRLVDGEPCGVCGSREHPAPAKALGDAREYAEVRKAREDVEIASKALDVARGALERADAAAQSLKCLVGPETMEALELQRRELSAKLKTADAGARRIPVLRNELVALKEAEAKAVEELNAARTAHTTEDRCASAAQGAAADRERSIPEELRATGALAEALAQVTESLKSLRSKLEAARKDVEIAASADAVATASARSSLDIASTAQKASEEVSAQFTEALDLAGFMSPADFQAAWRSEEQIREVERQERFFEEALLRAKARLERAEEAVATLERRDQAPIERELVQARSEADAAVRGEAEAQRESDSLGVLLERLTSVGDRKASTTKSYAVAGRLSQTAKGANPMRLTFQRFVLRSLLDDVMTAASARLRKMSRGRYDLRVAGEKGGLELEVSDARTGMPRSVTTLSGGEGFQAALSLALGLADVVQARAGGIRLDSVFVDEGFGSLDDEALDQAIRVLTELQDGGRLVGLISHVRELKERVTTRLEVTSGPESSSARFVVG